jgi:hypothetical protein
VVNEEPHARSIDPAARGWAGITPGTASARPLAPQSGGLIHRRPGSDLPGTGDPTGPG